MGLYVIIYFLFFVFTMLFTLPIKMNASKKNLYLSCCIFGLLSLFMAVRRDDMGVDLSRYLPGFIFISNNSLIDILETDGYLNYEYGYIIFNSIVGYICNNTQFFLASCSILTIFPIGWVIGKLSDNPFLSVLIYMTLPAYQMTFSGLRQAIAIAICFVALYYLIYKKWKPFVCLVLLASTFHQTALCFLFVYPLYKFPIDIGWRILSIGILPLIYLLRNPIFLLISNFAHYSVDLSNVGAIHLFLYFLTLYILLIYCEKYVKNVEFSGLLNIFYLACVIQFFGLLHPYATRLGYYFMIVLTILVPNAITGLYHDNINSKVLLNVVVSILFIGLGVYFIYNSGFACAYPYYFFWE